MKKLKYLVRLAAIAVFVLSSCSKNDPVTSESKDDSVTSKSSKEKNKIKSSSDSYVEGGTQMTYLYDVYFQDYPYLPDTEDIFFHYATIIWNGYSPYNSYNWPNYSLQVQYKLRTSTQWYNAGGGNGLYEIKGHEKPVEISAYDLPYGNGERIGIRIRLVHRSDSTIISHWSDREQAFYNNYGFGRPEQDDTQERLKMTVNVPQYPSDHKYYFYYSISFVEDNNRLLMDPSSCSLVYAPMPNLSNIFYRWKPNRRGKVTMTIMRTEEYWSYDPRNPNPGPFYRSKYRSKEATYEERMSDITFNFTDGDF